MRFLSVCSGLEGASLALDGLGWTAAGFAEIEAFPSAIIAARFGSNMPGEPLSRNAPPNFGDFTQIDLANLGRVDMLIGGTPCQAFSVAGKRMSLADARGNLTLAYVVLAHELAQSHGLRNAIWENVPGVLNTPDNAFGCFLGALVGSECAIPGPKGRGWPNFGMVGGPRGRAAWIVRDAQFFGLAQRRERVFVVADFGDGADPAAVLFEPQGVRGNSLPSRETRQSVAYDIAPSLTGSGRGVERPGESGGQDPVIAVAFGGNRSGPVEQSATLTAKGHRSDFEVETLVAHAFRTSPNCGAWDTSDRVDALTTGTDPSSHVLAFQTHGSNIEHSGPVSGTLQTNSDRASGSAPMVAFAIQERAVSENPNAGPDGMGVQEGVAYTLEARQQTQAVAFVLRGREGGAQFEGPHDTANIRAASGGSSRSYVAERWVVRRLTPTECERLQGVPDGWTMIPWRGKSADQCPDGNRYRALGNSWAVPVVRWIANCLTNELTKK